MTTSEQSSEIKANRKTSASAADDRGTYERTDFGRRRRSRIPKFFAMVIALVATPFVFVGKRRDRWRAWLGREP
jgi:hypothetical protein